jgi:cytochrome P450
MSRIGSQLLSSSKSVLTSQKPSSSIERSDVLGRDLLSLLVKANMATDLKEGQKMADNDVLGQIATFIVAGHETTSSGTTWALYALCLSPSTQTKLRSELLKVPTDYPTMDELNSLPYLDMVVREVMRLHAPVPSSIRVAMRDDFIPLGTPIVDKKGITREGIRYESPLPVSISLCL